MLKKGQMKVTSVIFTCILKKVYLNYDDRYCINRTSAEKNELTEILQYCKKKSIQARRKQS